MRSRGAVFLVFAGLLGVLAVMFVLILEGGNARGIESRNRGTDALARAKEALIFYAASYPDTHPGEVPGYLPCPDNDGGNPEGSAEPSCGTSDQAAIGRLPWRTLDLPDLRDGDGECLWYVVSGNYKNNPKTVLMNWDTNGLLTVHGAGGEVLAQGNTPAGAVAVLIGPGAIRGSQARSLDADASICGGNYAPAGYLDSAGGYNNAVVNGAANGVSDFVVGPGSGTFNDRVVWITATEIWAAIEKRKYLDPENPTGPRRTFEEILHRLTQRVAECIAEYAPLNDDYSWTDDRRLPWATNYPFPSGDYGPEASYNDQSSRYFGHVARTVDTSKSATYNTMTGTDLLPLCPGSLSALTFWWKNWKDQLFYAVSDEFAPNGDSNLTDCSGTDPCLRIDGSSRIHAAIVFFAGRALAGQTRVNNAGSALSTAKGSVSNYLEGRNATEALEGLGDDRNFETNAASTTFNDVLFCISNNLTVNQCP
jgi:hypothetical protein